VSGGEPTPETREFQQEFAPGQGDCFPARCDYDIALANDRMVAAKGLTDEALEPVAFDGAFGGLAADD